MSQVRKRFVSVFAILTVAIAVLSHASAQSSERVVDLVWNSTGQLIATVDYSGTVTVVDNAQQVVFESANNGFGTGIAWDPTTPELLAVSTRTQGTTLFNVITGGSIAYFDTDADTYSVSFSPDGRYIVTSHGTPGDGPLARGYITVTEIATGSSPMIFEDVPQRVALANWSPNGNLLAGLNIGDLGEVVVWDTSTGTVIQRLSEAQQTSDSELGTYVTGNISDFSWSPSGDILAVGTELQITFWDTATHSHIGTSDYVFVIEDLDWHPNEPIVAVASGYDRQIQLVDATSGQIVDIIPTSFDVLAVSWSPDGSHLAYGGKTDRLLEITEVGPIIIPTPTITPTSPPTITPTPSPVCTITVVAGDALGLVNAINAANNNGDSADTICLEDSTYTFLSASNAIALPSITTSITIVGNGAIIERGGGAPNFRLFNVTSSGALTLENLTIRNGNASGNNGGAILNTGSLTLDNVTLANNTARFGGGIHSSGTLTITDSTLTTNSAVEDGGTIYVNSGTLILSDTTVEGGSARYGSGVYLNNGSASLTNVTMRANNATEQGAGVYQRTGTLTITGGLFENNTACFGNGVYVDAGTTAISDVTMRDNAAVEEGAALYNRTGTVSVMDSIFEDNQARYGAAIANRGTISIVGSSFTDNSAVEDGGALYNASSASNNRVENSCFEGNTARFGGAVFSSTANFDARDNWWGAATGPTGEMVNSNVLFTPFLADGCPH